MRAITDGWGAKIAALVTLGAFSGAFHALLPEQKHTQGISGSQRQEFRVTYTIPYTPATPAVKTAPITEAPVEQVRIETNFPAPPVVETAKAAEPAADAQAEKASRPRLTAEILAQAFQLDSKRAARFASWVLEAEDTTGVPSELMAAVIATESSFRYKARSHVGAVGPAQVRPRFWQKFCGGNLNDPRSNVICGAKVLAHYRDSCDDWTCAIKKYNVGPTAYHKASVAPAMDRYLSKIQYNLGRLEDAVLKSLLAMTE